MGRHTAPRTRRRIALPATRPGSRGTVVVAGAAAAALAAVPVTMLWPEDAPLSGCDERTQVTISVAEQLAGVVRDAAARASEAGACTE